MVFPILLFLSIFAYQKKKDMTNYFIIPGLGGSGPDHWQTWFEKMNSNFQRIEQSDWNNPDIREWVANIDKTIEGYNPDSVVLVAHSLGCLAVAEWSACYKRKIKAALLVAPPDTVLLHEKLKITLFDNIPTDRINFPTLLVASTNDPWATIERAEFYAGNWESKFVNIGAAGHINDLSGYGEWVEGLRILKSLE